MQSDKPAPGGEHDVYSEKAELRRLAHIERVMRGEILIPGVPVLADLAGLNLSKNPETIGQ